MVKISEIRYTECGYFVTLKFTQKEVESKAGFNLKMLLNRVPSSTLKNLLISTLEELRKLNP